jgi:methylase of polypeptide subunit release factors
MRDTEARSAADQSLLALLRRLDDEAYDFVTPTPATHARVLARPDRRIGSNLRDILGWSLPFKAAEAPAYLVDMLQAAGLLQRCAEGLKSAIRVSRLHGRLFLHSAYPTEQRDAVFLGPDSYRFADFVAGELSGQERGAIVDTGAGAAVGAIVAAGIAPGARVIASDINPQALRFARVNAAHAGLAVETLKADGLEGAPTSLEVTLANPPYMAASDQTYRDGGDQHGARLSLDWADAALAHLKPGGRLLLYTGSAIVDGRDRLRAGLEDLAGRTGSALRYREIDPDVFGEELETPAYAEVERIAVVGAVITKPT